MQYIMPFILGLVVTMVWLPVLVKLANRWLFVDQPGGRKVHSVPIPRVGGVAMALGVSVAALLSIHLEQADRWFLASASILVAFGLADDRLDLDYRVKLLGQLLAVGLVVAAGKTRIDSIALDDRLWLPAWISFPLTVIFLVGITNAVNLADGLDGLAGGTTFLCLCAVALLSSVGVPGSPTALALAFAGAVLGFLRFNTYPASVFMGDAGSQLLGFSIGVLSIRATQNAASEISASIPILLLALPILDTLSVMVQRIAEGRSPFSADKNHIHHKLLAMGFDHHQAVMVIYGVQGFLFLAAYLLRYESDVLILALVGTFFIAAVAVLHIAARTGWSLRAPGIGAEPGRKLLARTSRRDVAERVSYNALAASLVAYAVLVVVKTSALSNDSRILIVVMLAVLACYAAVLRSAPLSVIEKAALYVTATLLVYLDTIVRPESRFLTVMSWCAVCIAALATAVRLRLYNDGRFQLTPLDLIVLFVALVVPSLPGPLSLSEGGALAIAKLVILYYAIEMLVSRSDERGALVRVAAAAVLAGLVVRPLVAIWPSS
jgi:UDP-GlcNAc:undecaprenyl-phosphate/decaprenyl-phosphate GlcNAc-1-phosphate transferase